MRRMARSLIVLLVAAATLGAVLGGARVTPASATPTNSEWYLEYSNCSAYGQYPNFCLPSEKVLIQVEGSKAMMKGEQPGSNDYSGTFGGNSLKFSYTSPVYEPHTV